MIPRRYRAIPAIAHALENDWDAVITRGNHVRLTKEHHTVHMAATPSCYRGMKNALAQVRRCERGDCTHVQTAQVSA